MEDQEANTILLVGGALSAEPLYPILKGSSEVSIEWVLTNSEARRVLGEKKVIGVIFDCRSASELEDAKQLMREVKAKEIGAVFLVGGEVKAEAVKEGQILKRPFSPAGILMAL